MKFVVAFTLLVASFSLFASELNGKTYSDPASIVSVMSGTFEELQNPSCIEQALRQDSDITLYLKAGYYISALSFVKKTDLMEGRVTLSHVKENSFIATSFLCRLK